MVCSPIEVAKGCTNRTSDLASEPIIIFPQAEKNRTYIAMGMQLSVNLTSLDPLTILASSKLYISYVSRTCA